jgi:hypothetical protein
MTSSTLPAVLSEFTTERNRRLVSLPVRMPNRTRQLIAQQSGGLCVFCGSQGMTLARLVPHGSGGVSRMPNLVYSCRTCHALRSQGAWDALELAEENNRALTPALAAQREEALMLCPQHPVPPAARRTLAECRAYLSATRWVHARIPFIVSTLGDRVLLAALQVPMGEAAASLLHEVREAGGRTEGSGIWSVASCEWQTLTWRLIDRHAVLYWCALNGAETGTHVSKTGKPWHERWDVLFDDVADTRRDAARKRHQGFRQSARSRSWEAGQRRRA